MSHFVLTTLWLLGLGMLGIAANIFVKVGDLNKLETNHSFKNVMGKFFAMEWPTYIVSGIVILIVALTHDEWTSDNQLVGIGPKIGSVAFGYMGQHWLYKLIGTDLGRDAKIKQETPSN